MRTETPTLILADNHASIDVVYAVGLSSLSEKRIQLKRIIKKKKKLTKVTSLHTRAEGNILKMCTEARFTTNGRDTVFFFFFIFTSWLTQKTKQIRENPLRRRLERLTARDFGTLTRDSEKEVAK